MLAAFQLKGHIKIVGSCPSTGVKKAPCLLLQRGATLGTTATGAACERACAAGAAPEVAASRGGESDFTKLADQTRLRLRDSSGTGADLDSLWL